MHYVHSVWDHLLPNHLILPVFSLALSATAALNRWLYIDSYSCALKAPFFVVVVKYATLLKAMLLTGCGTRKVEKRGKEMQILLKAILHQERLK